MTITLLRNATTPKKMLLRRLCVVVATVIGIFCQAASYDKSAIRYAETGIVSSAAGKRLGTGFVAGSGSIVVTADHVAISDTMWYQAFDDTTRIPMTIVHRDLDYDIACFALESAAINDSISAAIFNDNEIQRVLGSWISVKGEVILASIPVGFIELGSPSACGGFLTNVAKFNS